MGGDWGVFDKQLKVIFHGEEEDEAQIRQVKLYTEFMDEANPFFMSNLGHSSLTVVIESKYYPGNMFCGRSPESDLDVPPSLSLSISFWEEEEDNCRGAGWGDQNF